MRPFVAAASLAFLLLSVSPSFAVLPLVDRRGHLLSVEDSIEGIVLVDEAPDGTTTSETVSTTYDATLDIGPSIGLDDYDGEPVVVWSRLVGDYELAMAKRYPGGGWSPIDILTSNSTSDVEARVAVDPMSFAQVLWWPQGAGGPVYLQGFDTLNGHAAGQPARPFESPSNKKLSSNTIGGTSGTGGSDDPGIINHSATNAKKASAYPCQTNPLAAPDHGVLFSCGRAAAFQVTSCILIVGTLDESSGSWSQITTDLSTVPLANTTVKAIAQSLADSRCGP
ncbi:MAG TPA: hypothetical protein VFG76_07100 [Candidatus Polarisedimenticolia bacterium]|nr:hypothetical protein [Candidatus Polarisedimenticolia bacterium]